MRLIPADIDIDVQAHIDAVRGDEFWLFAAQEWHGLYAPYVPYDTGALCENVAFGPGHIDHVMPYAREVYEGHHRFRTDVHPLATRMWDHAAAETRLPQLVAAMQAYVDAGRLNIGESDDP